MSDYIKGLIEAGFDEKEAKVYLALLKIGQSGTTSIIRETGLHGQFVYNSLKKLVQDGYVQVSVKNGKNRYVAMSPYKIINRIKAQERSALELVESLNAITHIKNLQEVNTYSGEEEFRAINFESTEQEKIKGEILIIGGGGDKFLEIMQPVIQKYDAMRESRQIKIRYIGNESQRDMLRAQNFKRDNFSAKILPGLNTGLVNTNIFSEQVLLNIYGTPLYSIRIQNKDVAESYKNFFENIWKLSQPL